MQLKNKIPSSLLGWDFAFKDDNSERIKSCIHLQAGRFVVAEIMGAHTWQSKTKLLKIDLPDIEYPVSYKRSIYETTRKNQEWDTLTNGKSIVKTVV